VTAKLRSLSLREIRSWLAECESKKTALLNEFQHLERVYSSFPEQQEDWEYHLCDDLIPHLRLEISRRGARTGTQPKAPAKSSGQRAQAKDDEDKSGSNRARVEAYIEEVLRKKGKRITKKDFWKVAGYGDRTEFLRWQRADSKHPNEAAKKTFERVLRETSKVIFPAVSPLSPHLPTLNPS
jgi:hypothetical protein